MTLQQQAYGLIDRLSDDNLHVVIQFMTRMLPQETGQDVATSRMAAYLRMQELRKETAKYDLSDAQRGEALDEKFGSIL